MALSAEHTAEIYVDDDNTANMAQMGNARGARARRPPALLRHRQAQLHPALHLDAEPERQAGVTPTAIRCGDLGLLYDCIDARNHVYESTCFESPTENPSKEGDHILVIYREPNDFDSEQSAVSAENVAHGDAAVHTAMAFLAPTPTTNSTTTTISSTACEANGAESIQLVKVPSDTVSFLEFDDNGEGSEHAKAETPTTKRGGSGVDCGDTLRERAECRIWRSTCSICGRRPPFQPNRLENSKCWIWSWSCRVVSQTI